MLDDDQADAAAADILSTVVGLAGPLARAESKSHRVYLGEDVVLKLIEADNHSRLDRELALQAELPSGLSAPVIAAGTFVSPAGEVRYACATRLPGAPPPDRLAGVDRATALRWAGQAIEKLERLHRWTPRAGVAEVLRQPLDHGGFRGRDQLRAVIDEASAYGELTASTLAGLASIAASAPTTVAPTVPVHADCYWANWLVHDGDVTALLDFEWARFGEPADDWMFLARFSGEHMPSVLALIATETGTDLDQLRAAGEIREVSHVLADLVPALRVLDTNPRARPVADELSGELDALVTNRIWWR